MTSNYVKNSLEMTSKDKQEDSEVNTTLFKENKNNNTFPPQNDFFEEIIKELESNKIQKKEKENIEPNQFLNNNSNLDIINDPIIKDLNFPKEEYNQDILDNSQYARMKKLKEGLQIQPHFDFGIPLNENASLSIIQKYKDKKEINENFQKTLSKINILKWLKAYNILMNKEVQNVNLCLSQLKKIYSFDYSKSSVLCEVKRLYIIDCYQLLDVIDANFTMKKIILTKNVKKNSKDKGKIKIFYEYFVNIGDLILFKKPQTNPNIVYGEEYLDLDIKDIQKIMPFDNYEN